MKYQGGFILPERAENKIPASRLSFYEEKGWWAQFKKNGTNSIIIVKPDRTLEAYNRHGEHHRAWQFTEASADQFKRIAGNGWWVFNAELLHSKVTGGPRDTNYVHDVLVADSEYLVGKTYAQRHKILLDLFLWGSVEETVEKWVISPNLWVARNIRREFKHRFDSLTDSMDEGLVVKNPQGMMGPRPNPAFSVKCRKLHANYSF